MRHNSADLDSTFAALADPTRRAILARLALGEASVTELAKPFRISQPAISRHLKVLESAGLISRGREAQWRPARIEAAPLKEVAEWIGKYRQFWESELDSRSNSPQNQTTAFPSETELLITRIIGAPRSLVYDAWTRPEHLQHWQGAPQGMTTSDRAADLRNGGEYRVTMHAPDGTRHRLRGVYHEVVPGRKLVFTHFWVDEKGKPDKETLVTLTFDDEGEGTLLTLRQTGFESVGSRDGHSHGWNSAIDRFTEYVDTLDGSAA